MSDPSDPRAARLELLAKFDTMLGELQILSKTLGASARAIEQRAQQAGQDPARILEEVQGIRQNAAEALEGIGAIALAASHARARAVPDSEQPAPDEQSPSSASPDADH